MDYERYNIIQIQYMCKSEYFLYHAIFMFSDQTYRMHVKIYSFISHTAFPTLSPLPPFSLSLIVRITINTAKLINVCGTLHHTQLHAITIENTRYSSGGKYKWQISTIRKTANTLRTTSAIVGLSQVYLCLFRLSAFLLYPPLPLSRSSRAEAPLTF